MRQWVPLNWIASGDRSIYLWRCSATHYCHIFPRDCCTTNDNFKTTHPSNHTINHHKGRQDFLKKNYPTLDFLVCCFHSHMAAVLGLFSRRPHRPGFSLYCSKCSLGLRSQRSALSSRRPRPLDRPENFEREADRLFQREREKKKKKSATTKKRGAANNLCRLSLSHFLGRRSPLSL